MSPTEAAPDDVNLRTTLRTGTDDLHRRLDAHPWQRAVLQPGLTLERYAAYLASHAVAYERCERDIAALADRRPETLSVFQPRTPALRADLASIEAVTGQRVGRSTGDGDVVVNGFAAGRHDGSVGNDDAHRLGRYLGLRYVLDGATRGGVFIADRLTTYLPTLVDGPFAFWTFLAAEAPAWNRLTKVLAARPADDEVAEASRLAAREAFSVFLEAFDKYAADLPSGGGAT